MRTHIDWLAFTLYPEYPDDTFEGYTTAINTALVRVFGAENYLLAVGGDWRKREKSRAPYMDAWTNGDNDIVVFASSTLRHCSVEVTGTGCERLIALGILDGLLANVKDAVSRIDIATDIITDVTPQEFVSVTTHERMRTSGHQTSETGETCYVGSQKSDRYARVYRYYYPHPRHELLRVEVVFRRDHAKKVALACLDSGENSVARAAGNAFGFSHSVWKPDLAQHADISIVSDNRKGGNTVFWLIKSCAPAFKRLVKSGDIKDPEAFIHQFFMSD